MDEFDFSRALLELKNNSVVTRKGWNGKNMFIFLNKPNDDHLPYIVMKTADDKYVPWLCSQTDMLATDWYLPHGVFERVTSKCDNDKVIMINEHRQDI